jgi:hypothetical protein
LVSVDRLERQLDLVKYRITDGGWEVELYRLDNSAGTLGLYLRIPAPSRRNLGWLFALGPPPERAHADQIAGLLCRHLTEDGTITVNGDVWQDIADLYKTDIEIYRAPVKGVVPEQPPSRTTGGDTERTLRVDHTVTARTLVRDTGKHSNRTLRVVHEAGHYNALVPVGETDRIREIVDVNTEQALQRWYPLFRLKDPPAPGAPPVVDPAGKQRADPDDSTGLDDVN